MPGADKPNKAAEATPPHQGPATRTRSRTPSVQNSTPSLDEGPVGARMRGPIAAAAAVDLEAAPAATPAKAAPAANASNTPVAPAKAAPAAPKAPATGSSSQGAAAATQQAEPSLVGRLLGWLASPTTSQQQQQQEGVKPNSGSHVSAPKASQVEKQSVDLTEADSQEGEGEQLPPEQADGGDSEAVREEEKEEGEEALPAAGDAAQDQQQALAQAAALAEQVLHQLLDDLEAGGGKVDLFMLAMSHEEGPKYTQALQQVLPLGAMQGRRLIYSSSTDSCKPLRGSCAQADITHKLVDGSKTLQIRCLSRSDASAAQPGNGEQQSHVYDSFGEYMSHLQKDTVKLSTGEKLERVWLETPRIRLWDVALQVQTLTSAAQMAALHPAPAPIPPMVNAQHPAPVPAPAGSGTSSNTASRSPSPSRESTAAPSAVTPTASARTPDTRSRSTSVSRSLSASLAAAPAAPAAPAAALPAAAAPAAAVQGADDLETKVLAALSHNDDRVWEKAKEVLPVWDKLKSPKLVEAAGKLAELLKTMKDGLSAEAHDMLTALLTNSRRHMEECKPSTKAFKAVKENYNDLHKAATSSNKQAFAAALLKLLMQSQD